MRIRRIVLRAVLCASVLLTPASAAFCQEYLMGVIFPLSGPNVVYGETFSKGVALAIKNINDSKTLPYPIKALYEDSRGLPQPAILAMNKLVNVEHVPFVLSAFSGVTKAISPIATRRKVLVINGGGVSPELAGLSPYLFNDIPLVNEEIEALLPYATSKLHLKRISLIYVNDPFGQGVLSVFTKRCPTLGCAVLPISISPTASDFQAEVAKVRSAKSDAVFIASYGQQQNIILKELRDGGITAQLLGYSGMDLPDTIRLPAAQGLILTAEYVDFNAPDPLTRKFLDDFRKAYGTEPSFYQVNYYNAVLIYAQCLKRLVDNHKTVTGENLLQALKEIGTFDAVGGKITFRPDGTVHRPIQILKVVDGHLNTIATVQ